jgi:hypothetical protein
MGAQTPALQTKKHPLSLGMSDDDDDNEVQEINGPKATTSTESKSETKPKDDNVQHDKGTDNSKQPLNATMTVIGLKPESVMIFTEIHAKYEEHVRKFRHEWQGRLNQQGYDIEEKEHEIIRLELREELQDIIQLMMKDSRSSEADVFEALNIGKSYFVDDLANARHDTDQKEKENAKEAECENENADDAQTQSQEPQHHAEVEQSVPVTDVSQEESQTFMYDD